MVELKPYKTEARYYKLFIESTGTEASITESDITSATLYQNWIELPANFHCLDTKFDINSEVYTHEYVINFEQQMRFLVTGEQSFILPDPSVYDYMTVYVLGYFTHDTQ